MDSQATKKLAEDLDKALEANREVYERSRLTLMTAGLLVALSLNPKGFGAISIFGKSAYKFALICVGILAISIVIAYAANEIAMLKMKDFLNSSKKTQTSWQKKRKIVKLMAVIVSFLNFLDYVICVTAYSLFIYLVIKM